MGSPSGPGISDEPLFTRPPCQPKLGPSQSVFNTRDLGACIVDTPRSNPLFLQPWVGPSKPHQSGEGDRHLPSSALRILHRARPKKVAPRRWGVQPSPRPGREGCAAPDDPLTGLGEARPVRSLKLGTVRRGAGDPPGTRGLALGSKRPGVQLAGAKKTALTPPQTFPARPGAQGEGSYPGVGRWNSGSE